MEIQYNWCGSYFKSCGKIRLQASFIFLRALRVLRGDIHADCLPGISELRNLSYQVIKGGSHIMQISGGKLVATRTSIEFVVDWRVSRAKPSSGAYSISPAKKLSTSCMINSLERILRTTLTMSS